MLPIFTLSLFNMENCNGDMLKWIGGAIILLFFQSVSPLPPLREPTQQGQSREEGNFGGRLSFIDVSGRSPLLLI